MFASRLNETLGTTSIGDNDELWPVYNAEEEEAGERCNPFLATESSRASRCIRRDLCALAGHRPNRCVDRGTSRLSGQFSRRRSGCHSSCCSSHCPSHSCSPERTAFPNRRQISRINSQCISSQFASSRSPLQVEHSKSPLVGRHTASVGDRQWPVTCDACHHQIPGSRFSSNPRPYSTVITSTTTKPNLSIILTIMENQIKASELSELIKRRQAALTQPRSSILIYQLISPRFDLDFHLRFDANFNANSSVLVRHHGHLLVDCRAIDRLLSASSKRTLQDRRFLGEVKLARPTQFGERPKSLQIASSSNPSDNRRCLSCLDALTNSSINHNCSNHSSFSTPNLYPQLCIRFYKKEDDFTNYTRSVFYAFLSAADAAGSSVNLDKQRSARRKRRSAGKQSICYLMSDPMSDPNDASKVDRHSAEPIEQAVPNRFLFSSYPPVARLPGSRLIVGRLVGHLSCLFFCFVTQLIVDCIKVACSRRPDMRQRWHFTPFLRRSDHSETSDSSSSAVNLHLQPNFATLLTDRPNQINSTAQQISICIHNKQRIVHRPNLSTEPFRPTANSQSPSNQPKVQRLDRNPAILRRPSECHPVEAKNPVSDLRQPTESRQANSLRPTNEPLNNSDQPSATQTTNQKAPVRRPPSDPPNVPGLLNARRPTNNQRTNHREPLIEDHNQSTYLDDIRWSGRAASSRLSYWLSILIILLSITCSVR